MNMLQTCILREKGLLGDIFVLPTDCSQGLLDTSVDNTPTIGHWDSPEILKDSRNARLWKMWIFWHFKRASILILITTTKSMHSKIIELTFFLQMAVMDIFDIEWNVRIPFYWKSQGKQEFFQRFGSCSRPCSRSLCALFMFYISYYIMFLVLSYSHLFINIIIF